MLAVQTIHIIWHKSDKNPKSSKIRSKLGNPEKLKKIFMSESENDDIFLNYNYYIQKNNDFMDIVEQRNENLKHVFFVQNKQYEEYWKRTKEIAQKNQGSFYDDSKKLKIPCVEIQKQENDYKVRWYSNLAYMPVRKGRNERYFSHTEFQQRNVLNHTVFTLKPGESGKLQYNYRYTYWDTGIWQYNIIYVYLINTEENIIKPDVFSKTKYKYEYKELAKLL